MRTHADASGAGFISSDFGIHPVATLVRGLIERLAAVPRRVRVFCYALTDQPSWWRHNISLTAYTYTCVCPAIVRVRGGVCVCVCVYMCVRVAAVQHLAQEPRGLATG